MDDQVTYTRSTYEVIAGEFARVQAEGYPRLRDDVNSFAAALPARAVVADIGCGPGRDLGLLRGAGLRAVGLDLAGAMLRAGGHSGVAQADMRHLPVRAGSLDGIWCQAALLHIPHAYAPVALSEFARTLRPDGILHLCVAEGEGEGWEDGAYGTEHRRWFAYHLEGPLTALLAGPGLTVTEVRRHRYRRDWLILRAVKTA